MGQPLPLPQLIPSPTPEQRKTLQAMGITFPNGYDGKYVEYMLPDGWLMVDASWHQDNPIFYIIDDNSMIRVRISGPWLGAYDNILTMRIPDQTNLEKYIDDGKTELVPSETNYGAAISQVSESVDPRGRKAIRKPRRHAPYTPRGGLSRPIYRNK